MSAELHSVALLTIVAESILEKRLLDDLRDAGATGWTVSPAQGQGPRNRRVSEVEGGNIRVEILGSAQLCEAVWEKLHVDYFPHYAVSAWQSEVLVSRYGRYTSTESGLS